MIGSASLPPSKRSPFLSEWIDVVIMESRYVDLAGLGRIHVLTAGRGTIPLLLAHGWGSCARSFFNLMERSELTERFTMAAPDLLDHGRTAEGSTVNPTPDNQADLLRRVGEEVLGRARSWVAVGASLGGHVLLRTLLASPRRFSRALLLAPVLRRAQVVSRTMRWLQAKPGRDEWWVRPPWFAAVLASHSIDMLPEFSFRRYANRSGRAALREASKTRPRSLLAVRDLGDLRPSLRRLRIPTEIWYGDRDQILNPVDYETLAPVPRLRLRWMPGERHGLQATCENEIVAYLCNGSSRS